MRFSCFAAAGFFLITAARSQTSAPPVVQMLVPGFVVEELPRAGKPLAPEVIAQALDLSPAQVKTVTTG